MTIQSEGRPWNLALCLATALVPCAGQALIPDVTGLFQSQMSTKPMTADSQFQQPVMPMFPQQFLQPMQMPYVSALQMPDGNLRGAPAMPMSSSYQSPVSNMWPMMPAYQPSTPTSFYQQEIALEQQLMSMNNQLQQLKKEEEGQTQKLQAKTAETELAEKRLQEAEQKAKDADTTAKQLQEREQKVEDEAISAVRTAKTQVSQAQTEVKQMQDELRQAQADAIQARAAQAAAEEQVAKSEMLQAAQAQTDINKDMLGALSSVRRNSPVDEAQLRTGWPPR
ncbi:unnamed protein product [Durusdinium trenchii]|uniref:Uncharacterized protein n=1 Tax=Durusdinium trenchii TaxID=1381693 RepID=A0ABP0SL91_9DINO